MKSNTKDPWNNSQMSLKIAWKQNILVTDFHLLKSLLVAFGFGSQAFVCGFSRQNICSVLKKISFFKIGRSFESQVSSIENRLRCPCYMYQARAYEWMETKDVRRRQVAQKIRVLYLRAIWLNQHFFAMLSFFQSTFFHLLFKKLNHNF